MRAMNHSSHKSLHSSVVEHLTFVYKVIGSIPVGKSDFSFCSLSLMSS